MQFYLIQDSTSPDVPTFAPNAQSKMSVIASRVKNLQHMVSVFGQQCHNKVVVEEEADYLIDEQFPISFFLHTVLQHFSVQSCLLPVDAGEISFLLFLGIGVGYKSAGGSSIDLTWFSK